MVVGPATIIQLTPGYKRYKPCGCQEKAGRKELGCVLTVQARPSPPFRKAYVLPEWRTISGVTHLLQRADSIALNRYLGEVCRCTPRPGAVIADPRDAT